MLRILFFLMVTVLLVLADGLVLQTGQVKSYGVDGIVTDGSVKDDGYYQAGVVRSYSRRGDVVIDNATGLQWQDDETLEKSWATAVTYCNDLPLDSGGWRLPKIEELETLIDSSQEYPSATKGVFRHIVSGNYWSSTTRADHTGYAWVVTFVYGLSGLLNKPAELYVRCVRGEKLTPSNLSRDKVTEIVTDSTTGLQWQDNTVVETTEQNWIEAINYCENTLSLGGHNDWRLPNKNELSSIIDYSTQNPSIDGTFLYAANNYYWSSTSLANPTTVYATYAWIVFFDYGYSNNGNKPGSRYVRCVRGGQLGHLVNPSIIMYLLN